MNEIFRNNVKSLSKHYSSRLSFCEYDHKEALTTTTKIDSRCFELHRSISYSISFNLSSVSGVDCKGLYLSSEKEKENYCLAFTPL